MPFVAITHAGTKRDGQRLIADGGRVLNVTALGADVAEARARAYAAIAMIDWPGGFYRRDIGWRALKLALKTRLKLFGLGFRKDQHTGH